MSNSATSSTSDDGTYTVSSISADGSKLYVTLGTGQTWNDETTNAANVVALDTITRTSGSWTTDGFAAGQMICVNTGGASYTDQTQQNNGLDTVQAVSSDGKTLLLAPADKVYAETVTPTSITVLDSIALPSGSNWLTDGFVVGQTLNVSGTSHNNNLFTIAGIGADSTTVFVTPGVSLTNETTTSAKVSGISTITRGSGSWTTDGFEPGQSILVSGSQDNGASVLHIASISPDGSTLRLASTDTVTDEVVASGGQVSTVSNLSVTAAEVLPGSTTATASSNATANAGALIGVQSTDATATDNGQVTSYIGNSATLHVANELDVTATAESMQSATTSGVLGAIITAGSNQSTANSGTDATAYIGQDDTVNCNILNLAAEGGDNDYAGTTSGSGGIIAGVVADSATNHDGAVHAYVNSGTDIAANTVQIEAAHTDTFNGEADSTNASAVGASGAEADNTDTSTASAQCPIQTWTSRP